MAKLIAWIRNHLPTQRRLIQLYTALLYNAHVKGFISGTIYTGNSKLLCVPGLNCYSCPGAVGACPLGALQNAIASSGSRAPTYIMGILMLYGLILGRTICGFLCPFGLLQELLHKFPTPKLPKGRVTRALSWLKYVLLFVFVVIIPLAYALQNLTLPAFCKFICPAGTLEGAVGLLANPINADKYPMLGLLFTEKFVILVAIITICVFVYRAFCRFLCPLGAIYGLLARIAVISVKVDVPNCIDCGRCVQHCKMDIRHVGDHECIHCGECIDVCPTKAISFKAGRFTIHSPETNVGASADKKASVRRNRILAWTVALMLLGAALYWFNRPADIASTGNIPLNPPSETALPVGKDVGMLAPDFTVPVYGSEVLFTLNEHRGRKVIINFWATWCTPCCKELPYFDEIYRKYSESVSVVAIHSNLVTDDVEGYLVNYDYAMPFALDVAGEVIALYGGSTMLPQTVIVDEQGMIIYNAVGSLTPEKLEALVGADAAGS